MVYGEERKMSGVAENLSFSRDAMESICQPLTERSATSPLYAYRNEIYPASKSYNRSQVMMR